MGTVEAEDFLTTLLADEVTAAPAQAQTVCHFTVKSFVLKVLLDKAATVVPTHDVMPVLKCVRLEVHPERLRLVATDLELSILATTTLISVHTPGVVVFPARRLLDILKSADDGDVTIKVTGTTATITIGRACWTLRLPGGEDYPPMPQITEAGITHVERAEFTTALLAVRYAACRDPNRASLNMIEISGGNMTACDGSRFQQARIADFPVDLRIPIGAVDDLLRLLKLGDQDTIGVGQSDHHLIFSFGPDLFIANKIAAAFPDLEAMLLRPAQDNKHPLTVDRTELLRAIKRVRITADAESSAIALMVGAGSGGAPVELIVSARDKFGNASSEPLEAGWAGPARTIVVNHGYLTDLITAAGTDTLTFRLGADTKTRKSAVLLDDGAGRVGVVQQMLSDWVGQ